jgi:hypothetical protein
MFMYTKIKIVAEFLKSKFGIAVQYKNMTAVENVNAGNKVDLERVIGLGVLTAGIGSIPKVLSIDDLVDDRNSIPMFKRIKSKLDMFSLMIDYPMQHPSQRYVIIVKPI